MKKTIRDYDLSGKKVMIRCDFNVPMQNGKITDDNRIVASLPTIEYAIQNGAKIILMSHLGRIKTEEDKSKNSLKEVSIRLSELLKKDVIFIPFTRGKELETAISNLKDGDVLLMENTRFEDLDGKKESGNDSELGRYWASLGDIYINDAFGTAHRAHASNVGIASILPNGVGFLIEKELNVMKKAIDDPERPLTVILGGAKVVDKIPVIENLVKIADHILIGGGMAFTFLKAEGYEIGKSLLDSENIEFCKRILGENKDKIILPVDVACGTEMDNDVECRYTSIDDIHPNEMGLDIGEETVQLFWKYIKDSKTIIWNGPVGLFELDKFAKGTRTLCKELKESGAITIIGGGDTASAVINMGYGEYMTHISTGGGASLELLEGKELPGIACINEK